MGLLEILDHRLCGAAQEDAVTGIIAARAAGCFSAGLTTTFSEASLREAGADIVVGSYSEMRALLTAGDPTPGIQ